MNNNGFSKIEVLISILFLSAAGVFGFQMFERQKIATVKSTQEIETTTFLNDLRDILVDEDNCISTFLPSFESKQDRKVFIVNEIIKSVYDPNDKEYYDISIFRSSVSGSEKIGSSFLSIKSMRLIESKESEYKFEIEFDRGVGKNLSFVKKIPIYTKVVKDNLVSCSISPLVEKSSVWIESDDQLTFKNDKALSINTSLNSSSLNIKGPLLILESSDSCAKKENGEVLLHNNFLSMCMNQTSFLLERNYAFDF